MLTCFWQNASHPKTGILCAETIRAVVGSDKEPAYFEVCDLAADPRFSHLNIVEELDHAYYCGVPVRTSSNIVIGTVFVLDDKIREPLSSEHIHCECHSHIYLVPTSYNPFSIYCISTSRIHVTNSSSPYSNRRQRHDPPREPQTTNGR